MDENFNDIFDAIREYVLEALKNPINSGYKAELVPELIRILWDYTVLWLSTFFKRSESVSMNAATFSADSLVG